MRFKLNKLSENEKVKLIGEFYGAISLLKNRGEISLVFKDLMTGDEIGNFMRRIDVALLLMGGFTYDEIVKLLGVGKAKITLVQKKLEKNGGGYELLVKRLLEKRKDKKIQNIKVARTSGRLNSGSDFQRLKKKYPLHFLFWNILDEIGDRFIASEKLGDQRQFSKDFYSKRKT